MNEHILLLLSYILFLSSCNKNYWYKKHKGGLVFMPWIDAFKDQAILITNSDT